MFSIKKAKLKGLMNKKFLGTEMFFLGLNYKTFKKNFIGIDLIVCAEGRSRGR